MRVRDRGGVRGRVRARVRGGASPNLTLAGPCGCGCGCARRRLRPTLPLCPRALNRHPRPRPDPHPHPHPTPNPNPNPNPHQVRLGLWGRGTAFEDFKAFEEEINRAGVGMMEVYSEIWGRYGGDMGEIRWRYGEAGVEAPVPSCDW